MWLQPPWSGERVITFLLVWSPEGQSARALLVDDEAMQNAASLRLQRFAQIYWAKLRGIFQKRTKAVGKCADYTETQFAVINFTAPV